VEQAGKAISVVRPQAKGPVSMLARMGGRLISFYSDELAGLLLEDFLGETAVELQNIE